MIFFKENYEVICINFETTLFKGFTGGGPWVPSLLKQVFFLDAKLRSNYSVRTEWVDQSGRNTYVHTYIYIYIYTYIYTYIGIEALAAAVCTAVVTGPLTPRGRALSAVQGAAWRCTLLSTLESLARDAPVLN